MQSSLHSIRTPVVLVVLDGWGINPRKDGNAVALARTPTMDWLISRFPNCQLQASGESVGLLSGQMGDSNVGHLNLGAGRIVYQDLVRIDRSIAQKTFFENQVFVRCIENSKKAGTNLHLMILLSDGGVHSHISHLYATLQLAKKLGHPSVYIHAFLDGRDVPPTSGLQYVNDLSARIETEFPFARVATVMGRYYAMDRDKRWQRTKKAYDAMVHGIGERHASASAAVVSNYQRGITDEFIEPCVVENPGMKDGDGVIFLNFRADRARQISHALVDEDFTQFARGDAPKILFATMTQYEENLSQYCAFPPVYLHNTFGEVISRMGLRQIRVAETEKYAHVTYFFNGKKEEPFCGEERRLVASPKVATYDLKPEMSAPQVAAEAVAALESGRFACVIMNFANPDMVGHTGVLQAAIAAVEAVDRCLGEVIKAVLRTGGAALVLSDHGNAEQMVDYDTGEPHTAHTANPVPCILVDETRTGVRLRDGILADAAPTLLELMGIPKPEEMEGSSLIAPGN